MPLNITATDYNTAKQKIRNLWCKVNLLNENYQTVNSLEGRVIDGNINVDSNADIRRTANVTMVIEDASEEIKVGGEIWLDKFIQIYIGITEIATGEINWTNVGIYLINNPSITYNATTNTVAIAGLDLMAKITGLRNGNIPGLPLVIPQGSVVRDVVKDLIQQFTPFRKFIIQESNQITPYEIKVEKSSTLYDLLTQLRDITPNWEFYFDVDGVFHWNSIPTGHNEPVMIDDSLWDDVVISHNINVDFENVKNRIIVFGKSHDPYKWADKTTRSGNIYKATIESLTKPLEPNTSIGFLVNDPVAEPYLQINEYPAMRLQNEDGSAAVFDPTTEEIYYVARTIDETHALFLGHQQSYGEARDNNPDSPYYVKNPAGEIVLVCSGGEYDNIWTDDLARQRAEYELYLHCRMNDSLTLECVPLYWLDVNIIISYDEATVGDNGSYIIKSFSYGLKPESTMSITAVKYYPQYPYPLESNEVNVRDVVIGDGSGSLTIDSNQTLNPGIQLTPSTIINETVSWESKDPTIATVDDNGNISGVSDGETQVTVKVNDLVTDTINVTVKRGLLSTDMVTKYAVNIGCSSCQCEMPGPITIIDEGSWRTLRKGLAFDGLPSNHDWYADSLPFTLEDNTKYRIDVTVQNAPCSWSGSYYKQDINDTTNQGGHLVIPENGEDWSRAAIGSVFQRTLDMELPYFVRFPYVMWVAPVEFVSQESANCYWYSHVLPGDNSIVFYSEQPNTLNLSLTFTTPTKIESVLNPGTFVNDYMVSFRWADGLLDIDDPTNGPIKWSGDPIVRIRDLRITTL